WLGILILHDFCKRLDCIRRKFLAQSAHLRVTLWTTTWIAAYSFWKWSSFTWHFLAVPFCCHTETRLLTEAASGRHHWGRFFFATSRPLAIGELDASAFKRGLGSP